MSRRGHFGGARRRVGFITPGFGCGGAERWVLTLAKHLHGADIAGFLAHTDQGPLAAEARALGPIMTGDHAAQFAERCDIVIAWAWNQLADFRRIFRGQLIAVSHGSPGNQWGDNVTSRMGAVPGVELLAVSDNSLNVWPDRGSGIYIPNGAEVDRCTPRAGRSAMRERLGIKPEERVATFCGRICAEKRPWALVSALDWLPSSWVALIAGPDQAGWTKAMAQNPRVRVLPPQDHVGDVLAASDVFVLPSETEAHPIALCEAWIAGVPTVYADWPFAAQLRRDHGQDLGVPVRLDCSPAEIAAAILTAHTFRHTLADSTRRIAWQHYTASVMAHRWERHLGLAPIQRTDTASAY